MRKRLLFSLALAIIIFASSFPVVAAGDSDTYNSGSSASMEVVFEIEPEPLSPPNIPSVPDAPSATYTIIIPAVIDLNYQQKFEIRAENVSIPSPDDFVAVYIDGARTFATDGEFYLYNGEAESIRCDVFTGFSNYRFEQGDGHLLTGRNQNDRFVAEFADGYVAARALGAIFFQPIYTPQSIPGTYTGTVYFKISIENLQDFVWEY